MFMILLVFTLVLFTFYFIINSSEIEQNVMVSTGVIGTMEKFEVSHEVSNFYIPTKKNTKRYDDKLFEYLEHIQERRDATFLK